MTKYRQKQIERVIEFLLSKENRKVVPGKDGFQSFTEVFESVDKIQPESAKVRTDWRKAQRALYTEIAKAIIFNPKDAEGEQMAGMGGKFSLKKLKERGVVFVDNGMIWGNLPPEDLYKYGMLLFVRLGNE